MNSSLPKAFVFGAGRGAKSLLSFIARQYQVIALLDNNAQTWGSRVEGIPVCAPDIILETQYDSIVVSSNCGHRAIVEQLLGMGVDYGRINTDYLFAMETPRVLFLEKLGLLFAEQNMPGCVAEAGVFRGDFAREINRVFPAKQLFLFDTFSGFDARDVAVERERRYSQREAGYFHLTSEELVLENMPHPALCVIRKGYFPHSAEGLEETFCFVSLDFDLYQPMLAGLEYFVPRMAKGGVILVHDYFSEEFKGAKEAVRAFESKAGRLHLLPVGDLLSVGILC